MTKRALYQSLNCLVLLLIVVSCTKKIPKRYLEPKTQEGRNTIGYVLTSGDIVSGELTITDTIIRRADGGMAIAHYAEPPYQSNLLLEFDYDATTSNYVFADARFSLFGYKRGYLDSVAPGFLSINYQSTSIISGEFELNFQRIDSIYEADTLFAVINEPLEQLTKGRFDIRY